MTYIGHKITEKYPILLIADKFQKGRNKEKDCNPLSYIPSNNKSIKNNICTYLFQPIYLSFSLELVPFSVKSGTCKKNCKHMFEFARFLAILRKASKHAPSQT